MKKLLILLLCAVMLLTAVSCSKKDVGNDADNNASDEVVESTADNGNGDGSNVDEAKPQRPELNLTPMSGECGTNVEYTLSSDGTLTFTPTGEDPEFETYDLIETENDWGTPNSPWVDMRNNIYEVIIEEGIDYVPDRYFCDYNILTEVSLGNVDRIGDHSFKSCEALCEIVIPDTVTEIGDQAFYSCPMLKKLTLPKQMNKIGIDAFYGCPVESLEIPFGLETIYTGSFRFTSTALDKVVIPDSVRSISIDSFGPVKEVIVSPSVESISRDAFDTDYLERIYIPDSVTEIDDGAIEGENVTIYGLEGSRAQAYAENNGIPFVAEAIQYEETEEYKPDYDLGSITDSGIFTNTVEYSGNINWEYYGDTKTLVIFGEGMLSTVSSKEYPWYEYKDEVNALYIKPGVTKLGEDSFSGMDNLTELYLPSTLTVIDRDVFSWCNSLKELRIPEGVCYIYEDAFALCESLERVYLPSTLVYVEDDAFDMTSNFEVYYSGSREMYLNREINDIHLLEENVIFEE